MRRKNDVPAKPITFCNDADRIRRFWAKICRGDAEQCWEWQGSTNNNGYGVLSVPPIVGVYRYEVHMAHRIAWAIANGDTPLRVLHNCDNRLCCNPAHLFTGTSEMNTADRHSKGRTASGERNGNAKLTSKKVMDIRAKMDAGESPTRIARELNMDLRGIQAIKRRETWRNI